MALVINNSLNGAGLTAGGAPSVTPKTSGYISPGSNLPMSNVGAGIRAAGNFVGQSVQGLSALGQGIANYALSPASGQTAQQSPTLASPSMTTGGIAGLVSPQHPSGTVASSTITTNPDMSTQHKLTYDTSGGQSQTSQSQTSQAQPITGNTQTPSGATVNAGTGQLITAPPPTYLPSAGLQGQITANLANTAQQGTPQGQQYTQQLGTTAAVGNQLPNSYATQTAQYGAGNIPIGQDAAQLAANYGGQIAGVGQTAAQMEGVQGGGGYLPNSIGAVQGIQNEASLKQAALAQGLAAALQGTSQQLTGQQQAATAANEAGGIANTAQSNVQSGLNQAGGLAQAQQGLTQSGLQAAGQLASPAYATQQVGQGTTVLNAAGQPVATTPYISGVGSQAPYSVAPTTYGPGGQATTYAGGTPGGAGANNTPFTAGQAQGQAQLGSQAVQSNSALIQAQGVQQKLNADIQQNGINSLSSVNAANALNQWIQGNLSNPSYQTFFQDLTDYTGKIAPLIGVTGTMTDMKTAIGQQLINSTASGQTIMQGLDNLNSLALNTIGGINAAGNAPVGQGASAVGQGAQNAQTQTQGSQNTAPQQSMVFSGYSFVKDPATGQWTYTKT